jgi:DNA processing protein
LLSDGEKFARLRLYRTPRIGPVNFAHLLARFGTAQAALDALPHLVKRHGGALVATPVPKIEAEMVLAQNSGAQMLCLGEGDYPALLAQIDAAPPILWAKGSLRPKRQAVAIVGARNASAAGQKMASQLAHDLGALGFHTISGMARGIDTRAHEASLASGTVAILGGGVDDIYPEDNKGLYHAIAAQGLILSESPMGHRAKAKDFPRRNRLIAALGLGCVVVEAELRSGSLITARLAAEQNREVFAVPGSPLDPRARGCNDLLRHGAILCEHASDITSVLEPIIGFSEPTESYAHFTPAPMNADCAVSEDEISRLIPKIMGLLSHTPTSRDEILRLLGAPTFLGMAALTELEISGLIDIHDGGGISRMA